MNIDNFRITFVTEMMHQPIFDYLRTKKALGYIAMVKEWTRNGVGAIAINCSSKVTRHSVEEVEKTMIEAVNLLGTQFEQMSDDQFERSKMSYVKFLNKPHKSLKRLFMTNDKELIYRRYKFDRRKQEAEKLPEISKKDFIKFYKGQFYKKNEN